MAKVSKGVIGLIDDATKQVSGSLRQIGTNLGLSTDGLDSFSHTINLVSEKGKMLTEEQIAKEIETITDKLAHGLLPEVDRFGKIGETAIQTIQRLGSEFTALLDAATLLGNSVADSKAFMSGTSFEGRSAFVDQAGGVDALLQKAQFFADNFLTDAERLAPVQERLNGELSRLGLSTEITKEQFGDLVQSFGHVNGISEEMLNSLLNLAPAFISVRNTQDQLTAAAKAHEEQVKNERLGLENQLLQMEGNVVELRRRELEVLDPGNRALQEHIWALQDEKQAAEDARAAVGTAFGALQESVDKERQRITDNYNNELEKVNTHIQDVTESIGKLKSLSDALKATVSQIQPLSRDQATQQIQDAINTARRGGELPDANSLRNALAVLGNNQSITGVSSSFEFAREQAKTANLLGELGSLTDSQLTLEESSLAALEDRRGRLDQGFKDQIKRLDSLVEQGQREIDVLTGLNTTIQGLTEVLGNLNLQIVQNGGTPITDPLTGDIPINGNPNISKRQILNFVNTPGRTEMEIYNAARDNGISFAQYAAATGGNLQDLYKWADSKGLPRFAKGSFHRGGLRIVGERGPELEFTGPSRIASTNDLTK